MVKAIVGIAVALLVLAIVFPIALDEIGEMTDIFDSEAGDDYVGEEMEVLEPLLITLVPLLAIIAVALYLFPLDRFK